VYLANEVAQQSRARRKDEFPKAFSGVIAEAMEIAYRGTTPDVQNKLRRVIDVWRNRSVFELAVLDQIDQRLDGTSLIRCLADDSNRQCQR
jgi:regulator of Ty1 transposition protein 103